MVICLERGADLHMAQLMPLPLTVSCFSKIQIGVTFLVLAHPGRPGQRAVKRARVCVCTCVHACVCCIYQISSAEWLPIYFCVYAFAGWAVLALCLGVVCPSMHCMVLPSTSAFHSKDFNEIPLGSPSVGKHYFPHS